MVEKPRAPIVVIACQVFQGLIEHYLPDNYLESIQYLDYGLHNTPRKLARKIQDKLDQIEEPSLVILGYGLCGNGLDQIMSRKHSLLISRADDCIAILLGSYQAYRRQFDKAPGTYYLTKGWLESGSNPKDEYEKYVIKFGEETAIWIMDQQYQHYSRLVFVAHSKEDLDTYRPKAKEVAKFCERWGMTYSEMQGSEEYIATLVNTAIQPDKISSEFILIPPGGMLRQKVFLHTLGESK